MGRSGELPGELGSAFSTAVARRHGVTPARLRSGDLRAPFAGVRTRGIPTPAPEQGDPYERQRLQRIAHARAFAQRLHTGHFFSHQTAASIWGGPVPLERHDDGELVDMPTLHVTAFSPVAAPRSAGIVGHRTLAWLTSLTEHDGLRVSSPAATWAALGSLSTHDSVALGDYFCRRWRDGRGRPAPGRPPLATIDELRNALDAGRRHGAAKLRAALERIREDAWSPRESKVRCILCDAGLPEPLLNVDLYDDRGRFLGCADMVYPDQKIAIEYFGMVHDATWAADVERLAALRAAGWTVIEVTSQLLARPDELVRRVAAALAGAV